jgi:serine/threonine-protein kinase
MKICPSCQATYPDAIAFCSRDGSSLVELGAWSEGTVIRGRYQVLAKVGEGGMGTVYKVKHTGFDELRAIKVLNQALAHDEKLLQRFKQEAFITRKLQHPNAVRVDDIDEAEDGSPFIVMEYIAGRNLKQVLMEQGRLPAWRVCSIAKQVAAALEAAHALGMVHRDIKPENIVLIKTADGEQAKVLDFGIARVKEGGLGAPPKDMDLTGTGMVVGTPRYVSPEQAQGRRGDDLDGRADIYSLGIVMYEMLTGETPFHAESGMDTLIAHILQPPGPIRLVHPDVPIPEPLASLVMRTLEKDRDLRPASAAALIEELTRIENGLGVKPAAGALKPLAAPPAKPPVGAAIRPAPAPPAMPRVVRMATPAPAAPSDSAGPTPMKMRLLTAVALAAILGGIWYYLTHRPSEMLAEHRSNAEDLASRKLYPEAEQEYRAALQYDADSAPLKAALADVLIQQKKWDEGISMLREVISARPDDALAHNNLGVALQTEGNVPDAIPEYREALRLKPDYLEAHQNLGGALEKQNDLTGSMAEYREVLRLRPDDAEAHYHIGLALYKQGNSEGAVDEYREAVSLKPGFALAHFGLGAVLFNRGEHDAGIEELRTAYSLSPEDPEIRAAYQKLLEK